MVSSFPFLCFSVSVHIGWDFVTVTLEKLAAVKRSSLKWDAAWGFPQIFTCLFFSKMGDWIFGASAKLYFPWTVLYLAVGLWIGRLLTALRLQVWSCNAATRFFSQGSFCALWKSSIFAGICEPCALSSISLCSLDKALVTIWSQFKIQWSRSV